MLIYMASRAQLVAEVIQPSLAAGRVVISDRFLLSTLIYQGLAGGLPVGDLRRIGLAATAGLLPDLTIVLDVPPEAGRHRVGPARDRIEDRPADYQARVRAGYLEMARRYTETGEPHPDYPAPVVLLNALGDADAVFDQIKSEVERVLALGSRT
jgi:dTMP kinase